jgi:hypothetical protein
MRAHRGCHGSSTISGRARRNRAFRRQFTKDLCIPLFRGKFQTLEKSSALRPSGLIGPVRIAKTTPQAAD